MKTTIHNFQISLRGRSDSLTGLPVFVATEWGESETDAYAHLPSHITEAHPIDDLAFRMIATAERAVDTRTETEKAEAEARDEERRVAQRERIMESKASLVIDYIGDDPKAGSEDECCG